MSDDKPAVDREALADWLRSIHFDGTGCGTNGTSGCSNCCGPSPMNAYELAEAIVESSGVVQKADDVRAEALAPVQAALQEPMAVLSDVHAVLAGDTSALDAVKAEAVATAGLSVAGLIREYEVMIERRNDPACEEQDRWVQATLREVAKALRDLLENADSSALDAVKAAERERIAQGLDALPDVTARFGYISKADALRIAREGGEG